MGSGDGSSEIVGHQLVAALAYAQYRYYVSVRALVRNGRLIVDEATDLPEGTVLDLVFDDEGDQLDARPR